MGDYLASTFGDSAADLYDVMYSAPMRLIPVQVRYAWPAELDLMARLAA